MSENRPYVCGWDGGGTKTEVLCMAPDETILADESFGPLNLNGADQTKVASTIRDGVAFMGRLPGGLEACAALVIGTAGISNEAAVRLVTDTVRACGYHGPLRLLGDQEIALAGAIRGPGAVLVAGTGAICCAQDGQGHTTRVGGWGYLIDDEGSGYALGRDILKAVVRANDGRAPATALTAMAFDALGVNAAREVITWLYAPTTGKKEVAALAPLLLHALDMGDEAAQVIADNAAAALSELAVTAWQNLALHTGELAFIGSILVRYPRIRQGVMARCQAACPGMVIREPRGGAAQGAALLALDLLRQGA